MRVIRIYGHSDGYGTSLKTKNPIQPRLGVFSETALQRYDFFVDAASKVLSNCMYHQRSSALGPLVLLSVCNVDCGTESNEHQSPGSSSQTNQHRTDGWAPMLSFDPDTLFYRLCIAGRRQASGYCYELLVCLWFLLENAALLITTAKNTTMSCIN